MSNKKYIGNFKSEHEVLDKIDEMRVQGFSEDDMYIVTNDADSLSMVQGRTDVDLQSSEGNWMDRFKAFMSGDEPVKAAFTNMGFSSEETERYYNEVKRGGILLYVDREYNHSTTQYDAGLESNQLDENFGSNLTVDHSVDPVDNAANVHSNVDAEIAQEESVRLHEERLNVDKERVQTGEVNVGKHVVEEEQTVEVPVTREEVTIERRAVDDEVAAGGAFDDGEDIHIPITEEEIEVTKRPVVNEEVVVSKREVHDTETVSETVRREEADIDRSDELNKNRSTEATNDFNEAHSEDERERLRANSLNDNNRLI